MDADRLMAAPFHDDKCDPSVPRTYTIWPASQEDLPASTSGPWCQERHWLVLDVTDGIAVSYVVEGPVSHAEALHRLAEIQNVALVKLKSSEEDKANGQ